MLDNLVAASGAHSALETPGPELFWKSCGQGNGVQKRGGALSDSPAPRDVLATQLLRLGSSRAGGPPVICSCLSGLGLKEEASCRSNRPSLGKKRPRQGKWHQAREVCRGIEQWRKSLQSFTSVEVLRLQGGVS